MRRMITQKQIEKLENVNDHFYSDENLKWAIQPITKQAYEDGYNDETGIFSGVVYYGPDPDNAYVAIYVECDAAGNSPEEVMANWSAEGELVIKGEAYIDEGYYPEGRLDTGELEDIMNNKGIVPYPYVPISITPAYNFVIKTANIEDLDATDIHTGKLTTEDLISNKSSRIGGVTIGSVDTNFKVLVDNVEQSRIPGRTVIRRIDNKFIISSVHVPGSVLKIWFQAQNANGSPLTLFFHSNDDTHISASMTYTTTDMKHTGIITIDCTNFSSYYADFMIEILSETQVKFIDHPQA